VSYGARTGEGIKREMALDVDDTLSESSR
jgi:hypothetical protein